VTKLHFRYYMKLSFSDSVEKHRFSLKCIPKTDAKQQITITKQEIYPSSFISEGMDSFGNRLIYGYEENQHKYFFFDIEGDAVTGISKREKDAAEKEDAGLALMKYQTEITEPGETIREFYERISGSRLSLTEELREKYGLSEIRNPASAPQVDFALAVMDRLGSEYQYVQGVTDIHTAAENALQSGKGVCQDYAHIMLSLCRMKRIPVRYVTGMMLGEGKSHAWVEVWTGQEWIGMDPTNSQLAGEHYIKIAHGRDYSDCLVNQGIFTGNVTQDQQILVSVEET